MLKDVCSAAEGVWGEGGLQQMPLATGAGALPWACFLSGAWPRNSLHSFHLPLCSCVNDPARVPFIESTPPLIV